MRIRTATRNLAPLALMALLAACERPTGPPPPKVAASTAAPATVALSGTILDPQPNPVPAPAPQTQADTQATASRGAPTAGTGASGSGAAYSPQPPMATGVASVDQQALRDFQAEQEQRDRDLLDQDLDEAQQLARERALQRERDAAALDESMAAPPDDWTQGRQAYDLPPEDGDWASADEIPADDEPFIDEPPYEDDPALDDGYDPYRP